MKNKYSLAGYLIIGCLILFPFVTTARDIYVNNLTGSDNNSGLTKGQSFRTIKKAIATVRAGDLIYLTNTGTPYQESLVLNDLNGTAENRITIEGNGSTLSGSEPLKLSEWKQIGPGLYKNSSFYAEHRFVGDFTRIYFFLFNGEINRMGRSRKGPNADFKKIEDLKEKEWSFTANDSSFYLKIDPSRKLEDYKIEQPVRSNAVAVSGNTSYITVRNLICTHVFNDGFGLTGNNKKLRLENIQSRYCGDDGISAHANSQFEVYNFLSEGNATGIADTGNSDTYYDGVVIRGCIGTELLFLNERTGEATHTIKNVLVECNAANAVMINTMKPDGHMDIRMENVMILGNKNRDSLIKLDGPTDLYVTNCSFINLNVLLKGKSATIQNTLITGTNSFITTGDGWKGKSNIYKINRLNLDNKDYSTAANNLKEYKTTSLDKESIWIKTSVTSSPVRSGGIIAGADLSKMGLKKEVVGKYFQQRMAAIKGKETL